MRKHIKPLIKVLLTPSCWLRLDLTSSAVRALFDEILNWPLDELRIDDRNPYWVVLYRGDVEVRFWTGNWPYGWAHSGTVKHSGKTVFTWDNEMPTRCQVFQIKELMH